MAAAIASRDTFSFSFPQGAVGRSDAVDDAPAGAKFIHCPDSNVTCVKRTRSNTPLAALATLNNEVFNQAAKALGKRMIQEKVNDTDRIIRGFRLCVSREPSTKEQTLLNKLLHAARVFYKSHDTEAKVFNGDAEASAWAATARVILNMDEFIVRE